MANIEVNGMPPQAQVTEAVQTCKQDSDCPAGVVCDNGICRRPNIYYISDGFGHHHGGHHGGHGGRR